MFIKVITYSVLFINCYVTIPCHRTENCITLLSFWSISTNFFFLLFVTWLQMLFSKYENCQKLHTCPRLLRLKKKKLILAFIYLLLFFFKLWCEFIVKFNPFLFEFNIFNHFTFSQNFSALLCWKGRNILCDFPFHKEIITSNIRENAVFVLIYCLRICQYCLCRRQKFNTATSRKLYSDDKDRSLKSATESVFLMFFFAFVSYNTVV